MKNHCIRFLALLLAVIFALPTGAFAASETKTVTLGTAHIASDPAGADVYVDGELYAPAVTPCDVPLSAGEHAISVRMAGYDSVDTTAKPGDDVGVHLFATTPKPGDPGVRTIVVAWDDWGPADANFMTWEYYDMFIIRKTPRSDDWEDPDLITAYDYFTHFGEAAIGVTLREALCIVMNDTGWYDEENHIRWHYLIEFYEGKDEYLQASKITCFGRGTARWMEGDLFTKYTENGPVEDTDAVANWSHDGCFTINGDRDRDGTPDVTLYGWSGSAFSWDGRWDLMLMCSDARVTGLHFAQTMHVSCGIPFWQKQYYYNAEELYITDCTFDGYENGVGRYFGVSMDGRYGNGASGYGQPGTYDLNGFYVTGCTFNNDQLAFIFAGADVDYARAKHIVLQGNHVINGMIFVRNVDAHTWYMWPQRPDMSGTENGENCIGYAEYNTLEDVTISGNLVEFTEDVLEMNLYDGAYGNVLHLGNSNLGGSHNTMRDVTVRCNRSELPQANIDAYAYYPNAGVRIENAAVGDGKDDGYDGELASSLCEVTDNLFENLTIEYNDFRMNYFDVKNISLVGTAQTGTNNVFRNIRIENNRIDTVRGLRFSGADGTSNLGCVAEGALENVTVCDNEIRCLRKTGWSADSNINTSGEQEDYGIRVTGASVADYDGSNWDESGVEEVWDGLTAAVSDVRIERNTVAGFANGILIAGAQCDRTHYITGITVSNVTIADNEITTDGVNKNCRNDGISLFGAIDGGTNCVLHNVDVSRNCVTAANGLLAAGFYSRGTSRYGVRDNQVLHVTAKDNQFSYVDPRGYGAFPIVTADAVCDWGEILYPLSKTAVVLTESGNTDTGYSWKSMKLAELSLRSADDETAFLAAVQDCSDTAIGSRYIDWSKDTFTEPCETPIFMGVCDQPEYRPGGLHRYYLTPCDAGATFAYANEVAPTCTEPGVYLQTTYCALCNAELGNEIKEGKPALGHNFSLWAQSKAPTCTEAGEEVSTCSRCNAQETRQIAALGHDLVTDAAVPATCTQPGLTEGKHCTRCDYKEAQESVPALGHDWDDGEITKPATETEDGVKTYTCKRCAATRTELIPATGEMPCDHAHTHNEHQNATCTEPGFDRTVCDDCGKTVAEEISPSLGHDWEEPDYIWGADYSECTAYRICKRDASHVERETVKTTSKVTKEATYEEEGEIVYTATFTNSAFKTQTAAVATPKLTKPAENNPFKDVKEGDFFYDAVLWAVNAQPQVTAGTSKTTFSPSETCTRAQVVTFLWRAKGCPEPKSSNNPFKDVKEGEYYYKAVLWAVENNITAGTSKTTFSPNSGCTRAQVVTFLWRTEGQPKPTSSANPFSDVKGGYYYDAVLWAVEKNITAGTSATTFSPDNTCTRGQIVTFLFRAFAG